MLIEAVEDSLRIADEGRAGRTKDRYARAGTDSMEQRLRQTLAAAKDREHATVSPMCERNR